MTLLCFIWNTVYPVDGHFGLKSQDHTFQSSCLLDDKSYLSNIYKYSPLYVSTKHTKPNTSISFINSYKRPI